MLRPENYSLAISTTAEVARAAGIALDIIDVGGGFPAYHPNSEPLPLARYIDEINSAKRRFGFEGCALMCEPGRALVAEAESVIVKVLGRKDHDLYINDGTYGVFFEGAKIYGGLSYPVRLIRDGRFHEGEREPFSFWGPSCDSIDYMPGPFLLPADVREGDYIEVGHVGAYGRVSRSNFNGYGVCEEAILDDEPMVSMYASPGS
jgi:ornithine decarboxylase